MDASLLDRLTGGAFTAPTTSERSARIQEWLATDPAPEQMADVFRELSQRDKGAAKPLKEKMDDNKRQKAQESVAGEWAARAQALLGPPVFWPVPGNACGQAGAPCQRTLAALKRRWRR